MKRLYLEDLAGLTQEGVYRHISASYDVPIKELRKYQVLIAYESEGSWGCDSSSWFLLKGKEDGKLYETHGSHCSCYGFEGQFEPEETTVEYLQSPNFYFCCGGYDDNLDSNQGKVKAYIAEMKKESE